jgi:glucokinase
MILGIDIGATKTRLARLAGGGIETSERIATSPDPDAFLGDLFDLIDGFLSRKGIRNLKGIGIGAPGPLDLDRGIFRRLPNLGRWEDFDLPSSLRSRYGVAARIQNDANAAALGEALHGAGVNFGSVYYITLSTGIGAGFIFNGKIVSGRYHLTGEIWNLPVDSMGRQDILINASSGPGIVRNVRELIDRGEKSSLDALESFDAPDVFTHAQAGDEAARVVMENAARNMARVINAILVIIDPDVILLGGGLACDDACMIEPIRAHLKEEASFTAHRSADIRRAALWDEAVLYGALSLFDDA